MKKFKGAISASLAAAMVMSMGSVQLFAEQESETETQEEYQFSDDYDYEECKIKFDWWGGDARHEVTLKAIEAFEEKYPGIEVETNYGAWTDWESARVLEYKSGKGADVTQIGTNWVSDYSNDGQAFLDLETVSDVIDLSQWDDADLAFFKNSKGEQSAVPISMTGRICFWDKTTFDEAGIETPKSIEELREAGKTFKEKLGDDYYPLALASYDRMVFMTFYLQSKYDKQIITEDNELNFTQDELKDGLEFIQSLEDDHVIPSIKTIDGDAAASFDVNQKFIDGKYAGILEWDSAPGKYVSVLGDRELSVGDEFEDMGGETTGVYTKVSMGMAISANTEHPHEAAMLVQYLLNNPEGVEILGTQRGIPQSKIAYDTLKNEDALDFVVAEAHEKVLTAAAFSFNTKFDDASLKGETAAYNDVFGGLSYGDYDADTAAEILYDALAAVCK